MKKKQLAEELNTEMTAVVALEIEKRQEPVQYDVLENELDRYIMRLKETTNVLNKTRNELTKNNRRLERLDNEFQKAKLEKPVAQWHFRLFCEMLDDDRCTVPSHTLLVRLWKKVGLLKGLNDEN